VRVIDRRSTLKLVGAGVIAAGVTGSGAHAASASGIRWWSTTPDAAWQVGGSLAPEPAGGDMFARDVSILGPAQTITGFGGAFSELGWQALSALPAPRRGEAMAALFDAAGAAFTFCRTPIGANDFARKWYSYDETEGDFALARFSIANDRETLIPFIKAAQAVRPDLKVWASPWSPPAWMKRNKHYAQGPSWPGSPPNGLRPDQVVKEGQDGFIQEERYFDAYARYFRRYVEEYRKEGIPISAVMPQNEFNSAQPYPACCWTPQGLARFMPHLVREMGPQGVDVLFGTLERADPEMVAAVLADPAIRPAIKGIGVQWAGKGALEGLRKRYPDLPIWASEQECGVGRNDWHYARYGWDLMKRYFANGASVWNYWNMALPQPGKSTWGWPQNSLISVDTSRGSFTLTPDYWVMKHLASQVRPGAKLMTTMTLAGFEDQLVFRNPDGSTVVVIRNQGSQPQRVNLVLGNTKIVPLLPADSFNTIVVPAAVLA
jgi:glucosylceramidase